MTCNAEALSERVLTHTHVHVVIVCVVWLIKMCNRFTDPDMPLEQKVIIHTV